MRYLRFKVELLEDTAVSADATSTGGHQSLPYIPGAKFLGICASEYSQFASWDVFHSGRVHFGNAYPLAGQDQSNPIPRIWTEKTGNTDGPLKKYRGAFFADGTILKPDFIRRPKTAITRQRRGSALDHSFFDVMALKRGQEFGFDIRFDPALQSETNRIKRLLCDGPVAIGRSRGAEFGLLACSLVDEKEMSSGAIDLVEGRLDFFLNADLDPGFLDASDPALFGLDRSWHCTNPNQITYRRVMSFNSHRQLFTTERRVILRGTVISFSGGTLDQPTRDRIAQGLVSGFGASRAEGFGAVILNPSFLTGSLPVSPDAVGNTQTPSRPSDALFNWAVQRAGASSIDRDALDLARQVLSGMSGLLDAARDESRLSNLPLKDLRPSKSQWSAIRDVAQSTQDADDMEHKLFDDEIGLTQTGQSAKAWRFDDGTESFERRLRAPFKDEKIKARADRHRFLQLYLLNLSVEATRLLEREGRG